GDDGSLSLGAELIPNAGLSKCFAAPFDRPCALPFSGRAVSVRNGLSGSAFGRDASLGGNAALNERTDMEAGNDDCGRTSPRDDVVSIVFSTFGAGAAAAFALSSLGSGLKLKRE